MAGTVECLHARFSALIALCRTSSGDLHSGSSCSLSWACGGDAIEPPEEVAEEDEPSERGVRSRKWTVTTHPKKELWSAILAAGLALQGHRRAERPAGGARSVSQHLDARAPQRPASRPLRACGARLGAVLTTGSAHCRSHRTTGGGLVRCLLCLRFGGWKALCALLVLMFL